MAEFAPGTTVRLHGLTAKPELNGRTGTVSSFIAEKSRYAIVMTADNGKKEDAILIKPDNLQVVYDHAYDKEAADTLAAQEGAAGREARLAALVQQSASQHHLKEEAATHAAAVAAATSHATLADDVWDRVVEIQRLVHVGTTFCDAGFPALQAEAIAADDAEMWSKASVEYAHYLLAQPAAAAEQQQQQQQQQQLSPVDQGKRLAQRVLRIHGEARSRDALLAKMVLAAEGPFARSDADALLGEARPALIDVQAWQATKERTKMNAELKAHWDDVVQGSGIV